MRFKSRTINTIITPENTHEVAIYPKNDLQLSSRDNKSTETRKVVIFSHVEIIIRIKIR